jgi:hypothetical protein
VSGSNSQCTTIQKKIRRIKHKVLCNVTPSSLVYK